MGSWSPCVTGSCTSVGVGTEGIKEGFLGPSWLAVLVPRGQVIKGGWVTRRADLLRHLWACKETCPYSSNPPWAGCYMGNALFRHRQLLSSRAGISVLLPFSPGSFLTHPLSQPQQHPHTCGVPDATTADGSHDAGNLESSCWRITDIIFQITDSSFKALTTLYF